MRSVGTSRSVSRLNPRLTLLFGLACLALLACEGSTGPTGPTSGDVEQHRALWTAHHLTKYSYVYLETGFFNARSGRSFRVVVLADTVRSATDIATGAAWQGLAGDFPTLDGLFDRATASLAAGVLTAISYDSSTSYPSQLDLSGPPDASGSIFASGLLLLP